MAGGFFGVMPRLGAGAPPIAPGGLPALVASEDRALWSAALRPALEHGVLAWADPAGVAFHGELYNLPEIARELSLAAGAGADTVLRAGWQRWSTDLLDRLDGVFAIAVRDGSDLVLYRDPSGMRSLYAQIGDDGRLAFATDVQTLLNLPGTRRRLSRRSLHEYLRFLDIAAPHSIYDGVVAPEAGQAYRWSGGALRVVPLPARATGAQHAPATFEKAVEELDACLHRSVERRLAGAARPAAFLSGGVDSALVCAEAARCRDDMFAVTVGFEGAAYDESAMAERVASHLRMRHDILRFDRREYIAAFERLCREMSQPMADPATMATLLAFDLCRDRFDTVLDATGADEAAGLMPPRHVRLATEYASRLPANVRWSVSAMLHALPGTAGYAPVFDFEHPAETMIRWKGFMRPEVEALCGEPVSFEDTTFFRTYHRYPLRAHFERYSALLNAMPCDRLTEAMRISGTTVRFPFFDRATDGLIRRLPVDFRHVPGEPKRILRALLARHVPRSIWDGPKHGFDFPLRTFLAAQDHLLVRRYLSPERWEAAGLLAQRRIQDYASRFTAGDGRLTFRVWALVVLAAWLDAHELML